MDPISTVPRQYSLYDLTQLVGGQLEVPSLQNIWVVGEICDFSIRRHCYMNLIEKDADGDTIAQLRANIWANVLYRIKAKFVKSTGQQLENGLKVLFKGSVTYHAVYGISFNVVDIDPLYTLGDRERLRQQILRRLSDEGIIDQNKNRSFPLNPQRIAVVSSISAAGYRDFCHQLADNTQGIKFYTCLFPAEMQGQETVPSVLAALNRIEQSIAHFDCVAIIRGGGSENDLGWFDHYDLARKIALFPIPVITGIGHQHNVGVLDTVAAFPVKTPTAVADLLIDVCTAQLSALSSFAQRVVHLAQSRVAEERLWLQGRVPQIQRVVMSRMEQERLRVANLGARLSMNAKIKLQEERLQLDTFAVQVRNLSPQSVLQRGYSFTTIGGRTITHIGDVHQGEIVTTHLLDGTFSSQITNLTQQSE